MTPASRQLILVGAGLSNGLLADRLLALKPDLELVVLEGGAAPGGNHTWCFHDSDVSPAAMAWLAPYVSAKWESHDVAFPSFARTLPGTYLAIRSEDFAKRVTARLGARLRLDTRVKSVTSTSVVLDDGTTLEARAVIDGRGGAMADELVCGYQKFLGQEVRLAAPHGLVRPMLMDASVPQLDGFRFLYVLPWDERTVLIEDTRYSDTPDIDAPGFRAEITRYVQSRGWQLEQVVREELAALPIPLSGVRPDLKRPLIGVQGGFFHATTGYSVPFAVELAELIARLPSLDAPVLTRVLAERARHHWQSMGFFRVLNRMLFRGAEPSGRVTVFESFYRHSPELIARFYAGRLTWSDKLQALRRGAPTVPAGRAMRAALFG